MKRICVFCGSSLGNSSLYRESATKLGKLLAEKKIELVYGGAGVGLMGCVANACLENGGVVIGVIPKNLADMEVAHDRLTELRVVSTMHERKEVMSRLSDGFLSLPGGIGTLEETFEMFTWLQLGLQVKPMGMLNISGFYDDLKNLLQRMVAESFLLDQHRNMLLMEPDIAVLLEKLLLFKPVKLDKWFDRQKNMACS
ncbi:MAG: TIGR00730 family Rossman fold protein [Pseudomonadota bacterium]